MSLGKWAVVPFRYRPWKPRHLALIAGDLFRISEGTVRDDRLHLEAAVDWLCRAQDLRSSHTDAGGVSAGWSFEDGWLPSYPETSGYIVETMLAASQVLSRPELRERADRILDWELSLQNEEGAFPGHFNEAGSRPVIFNTGQIIHGMLAGYTELARRECLDSAVRAGRWMLRQQDPDGCWRRSVHNGVPHTYNTRAAWALLRTGLLAGETSLTEAAVRNLEWALTQQTPSGWFRENAFVNGQAPFTHTIAYALRGLLEGGVLTGEQRFLDAATTAARALAAAQRRDGSLTGAYGDAWHPIGGYCCLTGLAQTAIVWQRLDQIFSTNGLKENVDRAVHFLKGRQRITGKGDPTDGGIAGSYPIWGAYSRFEFPNWAAKFFADALMMRMVSVSVPAAAVGLGGTQAEVADA